MTSSRVLLATIGVVAVAASSLLLAAPASAASGDPTYVTAADIGPDAGPALNLPEGFATSSFPFPSAAVTMSVSGVVLPANTSIVYGFAADDSTFLMDGMTLGSHNHGDGGDGTFTFIVKTSDSSYVTVTSDGSAVADAATGAVWTLDNGGSLSRPATLQSISGRIVALNPIARVAGFAFRPAVAGAISDLSFGGKRFIFTPEPVVTTAPTSLSASALVNVGTTITTSGFLPNEVVDQYVFAPDGDGGPVGQFTADAEGVVTATYRGSGAVPLGDYSLTLAGSVPNPQLFRFTVTADVAVAAPVDNTRALAAPVDSTRSLAATGADAARPLGLAGALVALGLVLTLGPVRRRWRRSA